MAERSVNKAILVGRLGADAETRFTQNAYPCSAVSLAMIASGRIRQNQVHEETLDVYVIWTWRYVVCAGVSVPDQRSQVVYVEGAALQRRRVPTPCTK